MKRMSIGVGVLGALMVMGCGVEQSGEELEPSSPQTQMLATGTIAFYEGNGGTQTLLGTISDDPGQAYNLTKSNPTGIPNDEARSLVLYNVRAGAEIRVYDSSSGATDDDYAIITVKAAGLNGYVVQTFQQTYEDASVRVSYIRDNGLDGKVSRIVVN
ncbi:hypothetical protein CYFUS_009348 [Cystobacter fuscus]|uniref:Lipoprotein n=1 Tax=Cystobacter fuscus TaxID=43 RepID=A0A250JK60_9BACT|nr:hypothetical protein [Cystobacter fuscus]ATB43867.1 hypothetical protein CYFUS_009348 [Cystobacter fuscus]